METTKNILPNRIKFNATFSVDVNGKWAKDIIAGTNTAKNIWNAAIYSAKEAAKIDGTNEIIITVHLNTLCVGMVIATKKDGKTIITEEVYKSAVNFLLKGMEEEKTYNTPETSTPSNDTTMKENENNVQEYTHAANCLDVYLMNTSEIYDRFTVPAIEKIARYLPMWERIQKIPAGYVLDGCPTNMHPEDYAAVLSGPALLAAARLVQQHDHMTPTAQDIAAVKATYVAYIIECAQYQVNNA